MVGVSARRFLSLAVNEWRHLLADFLFAFFFQFLFRLVLFPENRPLPLL